MSPEDALDSVTRCASGSCGRVAVLTHGSLLGLPSALGHHVLKSLPAAASCSLAHDRKPLVSSCYVHVMFHIHYITYMQMRRHRRNEEGNAGSNWSQTSWAEVTGTLAGGDGQAAKDTEKTTLRLGGKVTLKWESIKALVVTSQTGRTKSKCWWQPEA